MSKELYMQIVEELESEGMSYEEASEKAWKELPDRLAAIIDYQHDQWKDSEL